MPVVYPDGCKTQTIQNLGGHSFRAGAKSWSPQGILRCILTSQRSAEARVPGVSDGSICSKTALASRIFCSVSKYPTKMAVPCDSSTNSSSPVASTPGGGPSDVLDPGNDLRDPLSGHVSESDDSCVHALLLIDWLARDHRPPAWRDALVRRRCTSYTQKTPPSAGLSGRWAVLGSNQ